VCLQVIRQALVDASGIGSMLATAECVIVEQPQPKGAGSEHPGSGMMDMY